MHDIIYICVCVCVCVCMRVHEIRYPETNAQVSAYWSH